MLTVVPDGCPGHEGGKDASPSLIDEIVREGALVRAGARFERGVLAERDQQGRAA